MSMFEFEEKHLDLAHGANVIGVILDNLIAGSLSYYLYKRGRGALER